MVSWEYLHQQVKVIFHQYPGKRVGDGRNMLVVKPEEMFVVVVLAENIAAIDSPVINVVIITSFKWYFRIGHVL